MATAAQRETSLAKDETVWKAISRIQDEWKLKDADIVHLCQIKSSSFSHWKQNKRIPLKKKPYSANIQTVISVISIYRSLAAAFSKPDDQIMWLKSPNKDFSEVSPLKFAMRSCENLFYLKSYLSYVRGRGA